MWINPIDMAESVFKSLAPEDKLKVKSNLNNYGYAIFAQFNYTPEQSQEFIDKLGSLLNEVKQ